MNSEIFCVMASGLSLSEAGRSALFDTAVRMTDRGEHKRKIFHDDVRGHVITEYESCQMGTAAGYLFDAEVITTKGITEIRFLVRTADLEDYDRSTMKWMKVKRKKRKCIDPEFN